jgi:hypothetical protein
LAKGETVYPRVEYYLALSLALSVAAALAVIAYYGLPRVAASFHVTMKIAPPPMPGIPAGEEALRLMGTVYVAFLLPLAVYSRRLARTLQQLDTQTISLIRDVLGLLRSGYSVTDAALITAKRDYGPLNVFTRRLARFLTSNYTFDEAFQEAIKGLPRHTRAFLHTILDAYHAGGRALEMASSVSSVFASIDSLEDLRRSAVSSYIYMLGVSVIMYAAVAAATLFLTSHLWQGGGGPLSPVLTPYEIRATLYYGAFIISLSGGIVAAKISAGTTKIAAWYALLYFLVSALTLEASLLLLR